MSVEREKRKREGEEGGGMKRRKTKQVRPNKNRGGLPNTTAAMVLWLDFTAILLRGIAYTRSLYGIALQYPGAPWMYNPGQLAHLHDDVWYVYPHVTNLSREVGGVKHR